jgi:colanic acid/amylovoran biosynthesis glycosyltransferase
VPVEGFDSEEWWELGSPPESVPGVEVPSRFIRPGTAQARAFHHVPQLGNWQRRAYAEVAKALKPDLIHAHYLTTGWLTSTAGRPLVIGTYGFDVSVMARRPLWRRAFRALARQGHVVLVEGPHMRKTVISLGFAADRVRIVRIAVGHEHIQFADDKSPGNGPLELLAAGRFVEKKGLAVAIRAFAALRSARPGAKLKIVGSGPLDADLRRIAAASGHEQSIEFLGALPRDQYLARLREADMLLAPSVTARNGDTEGGAPTTILDAQAVGTVVVASSHADIPFLVADGVTGFVAPEGDIEGFVDAVERSWADRERWKDIRNAARAQVLAHHSDAALASGLRDAYLAALG